MFVILYNTDLFASSLQVIRISVQTDKTALYLEACILPKLSRLQKREERSNITKHTGLLL